MKKFVCANEFCFGWNISRQFMIFPRPFNFCITNLVASYLCKHFDEPLVVLGNS